MAAAKETLLLLNEQAGELRTHLASLRQSLRETRQDISGNQDKQLRETNEELVLAALHANTIAESALTNLHQLTRISQRDVVTGMPNRALILDRLDNAITLARRHGTRIAVVFVDLDHFKPINDMLGHAGGDEVLQLVARRLQSVVRESDTVSRYGGDEFLVLLTDTSQPTDTARIVGKMMAALAAPVTVDGHTLRASASMGIATFPRDGDDATTLINRADAAMYRVKRAGGGDFEFHRGDSPAEQAREAGANHSPQLPITRYEFMPSDPASGLHDLHLANKQLILNTLLEQHSIADVRQTQRSQIEFMAMVAHELRSPLAPIRIAAGLLTRRGPAGEMPFERLQVIIEQQVAHMSKLIDDLLEGSHGSRRRLRLERDVVDLVHILSLAVTTCRPAMDVRSQKLAIRMSADPLLLSGDPARLTQIFCNLLDSASRYTPAGGDITLVLEALERTAKITVAGNRIDIPAELLPTIFDLFVQDMQWEPAAERAPGIGLAVARNLVEAHGGNVVCQSAGANSGREFVVTLPLTESAAGRTK